jgi:hypothetical protein
LRKKIWKNLRNRDIIKNFVTNHYTINCIISFFLWKKNFDGHRAFLHQLSSIKTNFIIIFIQAYNMSSNIVSVANELLNTYKKHHKNTKSMTTVTPTQINQNDTSSKNAAHIHPVQKFVWFTKSLRVIDLEFGIEKEQLSKAEIFFQISRHDRENETQPITSQLTSKHKTSENSWLIPMNGNVSSCHHH